MTELDLRALQRWMFEAVSHPQGVLAGHPREGEGSPSIESVLREGPELSARDGLEIYADMYFWRLIDILAGEYKVLRELLGQDDFGRLAQGYLERYPSTSYSLNELGRRLPGFIAEHFADARAPWLAELALLESAIEEVFDERQAPSLALAELTAIPGEAWPGARFDPIPALRLLAFEYPVNALYQALRNEEPWQEPTRRPAWAVVFRRDYVVWRADLELERYTLLSSLFQGDSLGEAISSCAELPGVDVSELTEQLGGWFKDWTSDGYFQAIRVS